MPAVSSSASDEALYDGDRGFYTVNERLDPAQLEHGQVSRAVNKRFDRGVAATRKGARILSWTNRVEGSEPDKIKPYGIVHGAARFSDPQTGQEWIIIAAAGKVYKARQSTASTEIPLPAGVVLEGRVHLLQAFDTMLLQRGPDLPTLIMDNLDHGFRMLPEPDLEADEMKIPNSDTAAAFGNRVFIPHSRDLVFVSDFLDYAKGQSVLNNFRINQGSADALVALYKFNDTTMIAAKENSIYFVANIRGDNETLAQNATLDSVTEEYGCKAAKSFAQVGNDVWFLAHKRGIVSVRQTEDNKLQGLDVPVSYPIQPVIDRINWDYAQNAVAAFYNNRYYLAVPLDDAIKWEDVIPQDATRTSENAYWDFSSSVSNQVDYFNIVSGATYYFVPPSNFVRLFMAGGDDVTEEGYFTATDDQVFVELTSSAYGDGSLRRAYVGYNNAILVYSTLNQGWYGWDQGDAIKVKEWVIFEHAGVLRLGYISDDGFIYLFEDGFHDHVGDQAGTITFTSIQDELLTRGYFGSEPGWKEAHDVRPTIAEWWPKYDIKTRFDGVNEERIIKADITRDRTAYYRPWDAEPYQLDNSNDDFHEPAREDYAVLHTAGSSIDPGSNGISPNLHQEAPQGFRARGSGRYMQVRVLGKQGRNEVRSMVVRVRPGTERYGPKA